MVIGSTWRSSVLYTTWQLQKTLPWARAARAGQVLAQEGRVNQIPWVTHQYIKYTFVGWHSPQHAVKIQCGGWAWLLGTRVGWLWHESPVRGRHVRGRSIVTVGIPGKREEGKNTGRCHHVGRHTLGVRCWQLRRNECGLRWGLTWRTPIST